jgi:hypothetical protein
MALSPKVRGFMSISHVGRKPIGCLMVFQRHPFYNADLHCFSVLKIDS